MIKMKKIVLFFLVGGGGGGVLECLYRNYEFRLYLAVACVFLISIHCNAIQNSEF